MRKSFKNILKWSLVWGSLPVMDWIDAASCYKSKDFEKAAKFYEKGLKKHPKHAAAICAQIDLGFCYFKLMNFEKAEILLRDAIRKSPQEKETYLRLAKVLMWIGNPQEASEVLKSAIETCLEDDQMDTELAVQFAFAVIESEGENTYLKDAITYLLQIKYDDLDDKRVEVVRACFALTRGETSKGRGILLSLVNIQGGVTPTSAHIYFSELLIQEGSLAHALRHLRIALKRQPNSPRVLTLLSELYLQRGEFYNTDYAVQLATKAAQNTSWINPSTVHVLAEAYNQHGDRMSALMTASKAMEIDKVRNGAYRKTENLNALIDTLSAGTIY